MDIYEMARLVSRCGTNLPKAIDSMNSFSRALEKIQKGLTMTQDNNTSAKIERLSTRITRLRDEYVDRMAWAFSMVADQSASGQGAKTEVLTRIEEIEAELMDHGFHISYSHKTGQTFIHVLKMEDL